MYNTFSSDLSTIIRKRTGLGKKGRPRVGESSFGTISGGYVGTFTGTFAPGTQPTSGYIGTFDYG